MFCTEGGKRVGWRGGDGVHCIEAGGSDGSEAGNTVGCNAGGSDGSEAGNTVGCGAGGSDGMAAGCSNGTEAGGTVGCGNVQGVGACGCEVGGGLLGVGCACACRHTSCQETVANEISPPRHRYPWQTGLWLIVLSSVRRREPSHDVRREAVRSGLVEAQTEQEGPAAVAAHGPSEQLSGPSWPRTTPHALPYLSYGRPWVVCYPGPPAT